MSIIIGNIYTRIKLKRNGSMKLITAINSFNLHDHNYSFIISNFKENNDQYIDTNMSSVSNNLKDSSVEKIFQYKFHKYNLDTQELEIDESSEHEEATENNNNSEKDIESLFNYPEKIVMKTDYEFNEEESFIECFNEFLIDMYFNYKTRQIFITQTSQLKTESQLFEVENKFITEYYNKFGFKKIITVEDFIGIKHNEYEEFYMEYAIPLLKKIHKNNNNKKEGFFENIKTKGNEEIKINDVIKKLLRERAKIDLLIENKDNDKKEGFERKIKEKIRSLIIFDINSIMESLSQNLIKHIFVSNYPYFMNVQKVQSLYKVILFL